MAQHNELGKIGEELAINYLQKKGYEILKKNYRYLKAEVDVIAQIENLLVAVEVKTRSSDYCENPQDAVNLKKINLLVTAMNNYVEENNLGVEIRFDIIAIVKRNNTFEIKHIEDAFLHF